MTAQVVVTGLGPVSSIGTGIEAFARALLSGVDGISQITRFESGGFERTIAGEVRDFDPERIVTLDTDQWGRSSLFAAAAARLAMTDAHLSETDIDPARCAVVVGTTSAESTQIEHAACVWAGEGQSCDPAVSCHDTSRIAPSRLSAAVAAELGFGGDAMTIATACSAGNYAIGWAHDLIRTGQADVVVAAGADSVCRWAHAGFHRLGTLARQRCAPFDVERDGLVTAEGGAAIVLESAEHAQARRARRYAVVHGYALTCDAHHMVSPSLEGVERCIRLAHQRAGVTPDQIGYISAHGTGTCVNDLVEATALRQVFAHPPPTSSIKSSLGHTMGAASLFGAMACALAVSDGVFAPTIHHHTLDPELEGLDVVGPTPRTGQVHTVQNNAFAFGGNNAIVIMGAP